MASNTPFQAGDRIPRSQSAHNRLPVLIWEEIICRYVTPREIVLDGGPENHTEVFRFLQEKGIRRVNISAYHATSNGPVEQAMRTLKDALSKMTGGYPDQESAEPLVI